jgi:hypothetical protein
MDAPVTRQWPAKPEGTAEPARIKDASPDGLAPQAARFAVP